MRPLTVLLDAPTTATGRHQIATLGDDFKDDRYGEFAITAGDVSEWKSNLAYLPGGRALIDLDHGADRKPRNSEAAGWITDVALEGDRPVAEIEWTPVGRKAIEEKRYLFFSPSYGQFKDEHGTVHDNTLVGGALTNKPFLTGMPVLTLASAETIDTALEQLTAESDQRLLDVLTTKQRNALPPSDFAVPPDGYPIHDLAHARNALARSSGKPEEAQVKAAVYKRYPQLKPGNGNSSDSQRSMDAATLIKTLELDEGSDDQKILDAIAALKTPPAPPAPPEPVKTLEQQAQEANKRLLDSDTYTRLLAQAAAGETALHQLQEQRFEHAFDDAVSKRKVTPAEKDSLHHFYTLDADATISMLESREPVVQPTPSGAPAIDLTTLGADADPQTLAANGIHPQSHALDIAIKAKLAEKGLPDSQYAVLLDQFMKNGRLL